MTPLWPRSEEQRKEGSLRPLNFLGVHGGEKRQIKARQFSLHHHLTTSINSAGMAGKGYCPSETRQSLSRFHLIECVIRSDHEPNKARNISLG